MQNNQPEFFRDFYIYGANFLAVAPAAAPSSSFAIQADSDFELQKLTFASDLNAGVQTSSTITIPQCTILITDTGSGRQLMNQAVDLTTFFGNGENPFILSRPKIFKANTTINIVLTNYSAAQTYNVRLSFIGVKLFRS